MSRSLLAILALAALVSLGLWLTMRAAALVDVSLLPARQLRRLRWWQANARNVQLGCIGVVAALGCVQLGLLLS